MAEAAWRAGDAWAAADAYKRALRGLEVAAGRECLAPGMDRMPLPAAEIARAEILNNLSLCVREANRHVKGQARLQPLQHLLDARKICVGVKRECLEHLHDRANLRTEAVTHSDFLIQRLRGWTVFQFV